MNRPGGNLTGIHLFVIGLEPKRLELLRELVPNTALIAVLVNPKSPEADSQVAFIRDAAGAVGQSVQLKASTEREIQAAFAALVQQRAGAVLIGADPFFNNQRQQLIELAARHGKPASYELREFAVDGGLMSYGNNLADAYRQVGAYAGRILKGEKPGDLPVVQPIKFELVINLKTARALGIDVPPTLIAHADEVIE
jgi:putative tryptophan/tyrosine transport system substrate-binding protein